MKYFVVLFKNKKKKKIINKFKFKKHAVNLYKKLIKESEKVFFNKKLHNTEECTFELGLISTKNEHDSPTYLKDELGRSHRVNIKSEDNLYYSYHHKDFKKQRFLLSHLKEETNYNYCREFYGARIKYNSLKKALED